MNENGVIEPKWHVQTYPLAPMLVSMEVKAFISLLAMSAEK